MSVAVRAPSHPAGHIMAPKSGAGAAPRLQARPSTSNTQQRTMAPRPTAPRPEAQARPSHPPSAGSSSKVASTPAATPRPALHSRASSTSSSVATPPAGPVAAAGNKDTSSSAGKIFAKPSKEWVLPERAKPGRKVSVEEPDNKRQSQNRLSQRAHRARRTDYIQTLEERLRQYEANEIHSNVRLQEVARALKVDNERLRNDVAALKTTCVELDGEKAAWAVERRAMQVNAMQMQAEIDALRAGQSVQTIVRMEVDQEAIDRLVPSMPRRTSTSTSLPVIATHSTHTTQPTRKPTIDCPICPDPDPDCPCQQPQQSAAVDIYTPAREQNPTLAPADGDHESCGFCHSTEECLCRVVHEDHDIKPDISSSPSNSFKPDDGCGLCTSSSFCACRAALDSPSTSSSKVSQGGSGIMMSLATPASSAALPLRLRARSGTGVTKTPIWSLTTGETISSSTSAATPLRPKPAKPVEAVCTGDPSNCDACRNDSFGREFCQHLFEATGDASGTFKPCAECPGNCMSIKSLLSASPSPSSAIASSSRPRAAAPAPAPILLEDEAPPLAPLQMACCGNPELCGGHHGTGCTGEVVALGRAGEDREEEDRTTMRPDQAWKQLKAHPNAKFASLALLADVVARRTVCLQQDADADAADLPSYPTTRSAPSANSEVIDNHTSSAPGHVPAIQSGIGLKKRTLGVETSGLRDALKLLDRATPTPSAASPVREVEDRTVKRRKLEL